MIRKIEGIREKRREEEEEERKGYEKGYVVREKEGEGKGSKRLRKN